MDRRLFLTGLLSIAGTAAVVGVMRPGDAFAGVPNGSGILDELDEPLVDELVETDDEATVQPVWHRRWHRPRRRRPRWVIRRVCRRYWRNGRTRVRCWRERVRVFRRW